MFNKNVRKLFTLFEHRYCFLSRFFTYRFLQFFEGQTKKIVKRGQLGGKGLIGSGGGGVISATNKNNFFF